MVLMWLAIIVHVVFLSKVLQRHHASPSNAKLFGVSYGLFGLTLMALSGLRVESAFPAAMAISMVGTAIVWIWKRPAQHDV
jgi:uncharacterized membrane protein YjjB (DUF3815 family)